MSKWIAYIFLFLLFLELFLGAIAWVVIYYYDDLLKREDREYEAEIKRRIFEALERYRQKVRVQQRRESFPRIIERFKRMDEEKCRVQ